MHKKRGRMFSLSCPPVQHRNLSSDHIYRQQTLPVPCLRPLNTTMAIIEELTDGSSNARLRAVQRRSQSLEVMRRKVVFSTHLNPTSIWLWGRTAKTEEGSCQLTGITGAKPGSMGNLHLWRLSWSGVLLVGVFFPPSVLIVGLLWPWLIFSPASQSTSCSFTSSQPAPQCYSSSSTSCPFPTPWKEEPFCGSCFCTPFPIHRLIES